MAKLSPEQLDLYLQRVHLERDAVSTHDVTSLSLLLRHQLVYVPFESLSLHYSKDRKISIDLQDLYFKIVTKRRGGYCLENNAFFAAILRTLGYQVMSVGCRITMATRGIYDGSWRGMSHMANVVTINDKRYLVDVGFGADGPSRPLPLDESGAIVPGTPGQDLQLQYRNLAQHSNPSQRVWVYEQRRFSESWNEVYHFADAEHFPADFEILNFYNMTLSVFAKTVIVQRFTFDETESSAQIDGTLQLVRNQLERRSKSGREILETYDSEQERLVAFVKHFQIDLAEDERTAITDRPGELLRVSSMKAQE